MRVRVAAKWGQRSRPHAAHASPTTERGGRELCTSAIHRRLTRVAAAAGGREGGGRGAGAGGGRTFHSSMAPTHSSQSFCLNLRALSIGVWPCWERAGARETSAGEAHAACRRLRACGGGEARRQHARAGLGAVGVEVRVRARVAVAVEGSRSGSAVNELGGGWNPTWIRHSLLIKHGDTARGSFGRAGMRALQVWAARRRSGRPAWC